MKSYDLRLTNTVSYTRQNKVVLLTRKLLDLLVDFEMNDYGDDIPPIVPILWTKNLLKEYKPNLEDGIPIHNSRFSGLVKIEYLSSIEMWSFNVGEIELTLFEYWHELENIFYCLTGQNINDYKLW